MIIDKRQQVSSDQALTGTSDVVSEDIIDLKQSENIGPGEPLWWVIAAKTGLGGTSPTLDIKVETDDAEGFGSAETLVSHPQLAESDFATGDRVVIPMPMTNKRYLRLVYNMGGTSPTATVDAFLTNQEPESWKSFANAI